MEKESVAEILKANPWFAALSPPHFEKMVEIATEMSWPAGQTVFREGQRGDYMYLIIEGQVALDIYAPNKGRLTILTLGANEVFGWSAVVPYTQMRTAAARTIKPTCAIALDSAALRAACEADHELGYLVYRRLTNIIAGRLTATRLQLLDVYGGSTGD
ncbi:MAG: Crp/Fnr family transcriptional regulator [Chloroflexi bacterium]|nr:Crp/Fnr family transcriptional regulator [Chloroflexota bacterium]